MVDVILYCVHCGYRHPEGAERVYSCPSCKIRTEYSDDGHAPMLRSHIVGEDGPLLSHDEAKKMLAQLRRYYGEPVLPLSRVCTAFAFWFGAIATLNTREPRDKHDTFKHRLGHAWYKHIREIRTAISKSSLLGRLLHDGEQFRRRECPEHRGKWSGLDNPENPCPHGCGMTGWLPEDGDPLFVERAARQAELESFPILTEESALASALAYAMTTLKPPVKDREKISAELKAMGFRLGRRRGTKDGKTAYYLQYRDSRYPYGWTALTNRHAEKREPVCITIEE